jgi:NAD(P)-dependent dehydrogenase (short-subunit alcohol dehydrogenase family)
MKEQIPPLSMRGTSLVTGAAGNLGQAVVHKFIKEGYRVVGTVTKEEERTYTQEFETEIVNLLEEDAASGFVKKVIDKYNQVDIAVLTVGGFAMGNIESASTSDILKQYRLNFETTYNIARPVFIQMRKQGFGRIFMTGSKPGLNAGNGKGMIAYGLAKSLLFRLAELMNDEAKGYNVVTSVVVPGTIDTPQNRNAMPDADFSKWVKPETIADIIYYYSTEEASVLKEPVLKVYGSE